MSSMDSSSQSNSSVHSECASSQFQPQPKEEEVVTSEDAKMKKEFVEEEAYEDLASLDDQEKYKKIEADFARYLTAKYFSDKTIFGDEIFDVKVTNDGQTVKTSRLPPYQSYADPASFHELLNNVSKSEEEAPAETSNGKLDTKKST